MDFCTGQRKCRPDTDREAVQDPATVSRVIKVKTLSANNCHRSVRERKPCDGKVRIGTFVAVRVAVHIRLTYGDWP